MMMLKKYLSLQFLWFFHVVNNFCLFIVHNIVKKFGLLYIGVYKQLIQLNWLKHFQKYSETLVVIVLVLYFKVVP